MEIPIAFSIGLFIGEAIVAIITYIHMFCGKGWAKYENAYDDGYESGYSTGLEIGKELGKNEMFRTFRNIIMGYPDKKQD